MPLRGVVPYPPASKPSGLEAGAEPIGAQDMFHKLHEKILKDFEICDTYHSYLLIINL